jgi:hypothetical protein
VVVLALAAGAVVTVILTQGGGDSPAGSNTASTTKAPPGPPIQGLQVKVDNLIYNVTDVRVLDYDSPSAAPYLVNLRRPAKGSGYLGVFMRVYNRTKRDQVSAPGFLLEPSKQPGLVLMNNASESPYSLQQGAKVPAGSVLPVPGSAPASGTFPGGLLLYAINGDTTKNQPLDLIIHTAKGTLGKIRLPPVPKLTGKPSHG